MKKKTEKAKLLTPEDIAYTRRQVRDIYEGTPTFRLEDIYVHVKNNHTTVSIKLEILEELLNERQPDWKLRQYID